METIQNAAYDNDGKKSGWLTSNADKGLDHENRSTERKFAEGIMFGAFNKLYHWDMICILFFSRISLNLNSQISCYSYNKSQTAYKLSMIRCRMNIAPAWLEASVATQIAASPPAWLGAAGVWAWLVMRRVDKRDLLIISGGGFRNWWLVRSLGSGPSALLFFSSFFLILLGFGFEALFFAVAVLFVFPTHTLHSPSRIDRGEFPGVAAMWLHLAGRPVRPGASIRRWGRCLAPDAHPTKFRMCIQFQKQGFDVAGNFGEADSEEEKDRAEKRSQTGVRRERGSGEQRGWRAGG